MEYSDQIQRCLQVPCKHTETEQEIASRFRRAVKDPEHEEVAGTDSLVTLQHASMKLGQLARAKLPREEVESVTPREFRHDDAPFNQL